jgi:sulfane dehydrogenase subunit SoxC
MYDLRRLPALSIIGFMECAGNAGREHFGNPCPTDQLSHGLVNCSEWTGVLLSALLREAGSKSTASWVVAEGCRCCSSCPQHPSTT